MQPSRFLAAILFFGFLWGEGSPPRGPAVGARVPEFRAEDQNGHAQSLETLRGPKGLMLLFARSADWCPYCKAELVELQQKLADFRKQGLGVAAITYDSPALLRQFAARKGITFPLLGDPESKIIKAFGLLDTSIQPGEFGYGVPLQGTYVIDAQGVVRARYVDDDHTRHYTAASVLARQFGIADGVPRGTAETKQLTLSWGASDRKASAGARVLLTLDIDLKPGMHLYAPGVGGEYIPIDWQIPEAKAWRAHPVTYPPSTMLHLPAIGETVPVYRGHIRLVRDLALGGIPEMKAAGASQGALKIPGSFRYQACDDRLCYPPRTLPLEWSFEIEPPDSQRAPAELRRK